MKILHICPLWFPIGEDAPGGIETVLARLISSLAQLGCKSTLLAVEGSVAEAEIIPGFSEGVRAKMERGAATEYEYYVQHQVRRALELAPQFDVVHSHVGVGAFILSGVPGIGPRVLHTLHTPIYADMVWYVERHPDLWLSTVSEFQARRLGYPPRCQVIPSGISISSFDFSPAKGEGLFFLGRIEEAKGPDLAVEVARTLGLPLTMAGPITDKQFFKKKIEPSLNDKIRYVGLVNHQEKKDYFAHSACVILPFRGDESFGVVSVEAMACGTPVVSLANGALPEIVETGVTGYLTDSERELAPLVRQAFALDRRKIRQRAEERFDITPVAGKYLRLYKRIVSAPR